MERRKFTMDQYIGKLLDNRYEILELIGVGGMARVYKARCHRLNRLVAVKILRDDLVQDAELRRRFHDESQAVAMLSHPNIVAVYDVSRSSDFEYIVMELIDGITLKQYMQKKGNKLNWREALHFITQIVKALGHAHSRGIIHRDIKPHNIMVLRDGSVKVADFGIARVASGGHSTLTQEALGSVHYISPEQARGSHIDARSDLYSAGVVLYEMITGRLPFEGDTPVSVAIQHINSIPLSPREIDPSIPEALEAITMRAMAPNPDNRYPSADAMLADLEEFRKNPNINLDYGPGDLPGDFLDDGDRTQILNTAQVNAVRAWEGLLLCLIGAAIGSAIIFFFVKLLGVKMVEAFISREKINSLKFIKSSRRLNLLMFILFSSLFSDTLGPNQNSIRVPSVVGMMFDQAKNDQELLGEFTLEQAGEAESEKPAGTILEQDPGANSLVSSSGTIRVTVSSGPADEVLMPDLTNVPLQSALSQLNGLGEFDIDFTSRTDYDDHIPKDSVISTIPAKDQPLTEGTKIYLTISLGKEEETVTMMDLRGMTQEQAEKAITGLGLAVGSVDHSSSDMPAGQVWFQSVEPKDEVAPGTNVNIIISTGPDGGGQQSSKTVTFNLPDSGEIVSVQVIDGSGNTVWGPEEKDTNLEVAVEVTVSGSGTEEFTLLVNGSAYSTKTVDFEAE